MSRVLPSCRHSLTIGCTATDFLPLRGSKPAREPGVSFYKVLRADLESLPIFSEYFSKGRGFSEESFLEYLSLEEVAGGTYRIKK